MVFQILNNKIGLRQGCVLKVQYFISGTAVDMLAKLYGAWKTLFLFQDISEEVTPSGTETGVFRANLTSTKSPNDLAPWVDTTSAALMLTMHYQFAGPFFNDDFNYIVPSLNVKNVENATTFYDYLNKSSTT